MHQDLKTCLAIIKDTAQYPLPVKEYLSTVEVGCTLVFTDYSGHLLASPSLGIYSPSQSSEDKALVCSLAYPRYFLQAEDESGHKAFSKSTALEALGFLVPLLKDPARFISTHTLVVTDNAAAVLIFKKGYSKGDSWATTICRAARIVAAALCCKLEVKWERRRSSRASRIADNLTHNLLEELDDSEIDAYLEGDSVTFPLPILQWMSDPKPDYSLGARCIKWMVQTYPFFQQIQKSDC